MGVVAGIVCRGLMTLEIGAHTDDRNTTDNESGDGKGESQEQ